VFESRPLGHLDYVDDDDFIGFLRELHARELAKDEAGLFSPAHFDTEMAAAHGGGECPTRASNRLLKNSMAADGWA